jgi:AraC-like DNA-binding protein
MSERWTPRPAEGTHAGFGLLWCGQAWLELPEGSERIRLSHGDFFLLAPGREYAIYADEGSAPGSIIAGRFNFDDTLGKPLADFFPRLISIRAGQTHMPALRKTLELLASEVDASTHRSEQGSEVAVSRLADLLLIQALRAHIANAPEEDTGWLRAFGDIQIGAALNSMHERIDHRWTVASLASEAGMSRSAFAQRFKELMSESPLEYLTRWRMYRGIHLLRESDRKLADVAQAVGYDSDGAFHKAFKRVLGVAPGEYRRSVGAM